MSLASALMLLVAASFALPVGAMAQSASPTLPSDTLEANFAPKSDPGPVPELAPSLPSDTLDVRAPITYPDSTSGEMQQEWDQDDGGEPWRHEENDDDTEDSHLQALEFKLG